MGKPVGTGMAGEVSSSLAGSNLVVTPGVVLRARKGNQPTKKRLDNNHHQWRKKAKDLETVNTLNSNGVLKLNLQYKIY